MNTSSRIKALLELTGKSQIDLACAFGMTSSQALANKMRRGSWSAKDLARVAAFCGAELAFLLPDGSRLILAPETQED